MMCSVVMRGTVSHILARHESRSFTYKHDSTIIHMQTRFRKSQVENQRPRNVPRADEGWDQCSNRLGVRLEGPAPQWARNDGGEGGSHPSNVHDHVYALGTINFTGALLGPCVCLRKKFRIQLRAIPALVTLLRSWRLIGMLDSSAHHYCAPAT